MTAGGRVGAIVLAGGRSARFGRDKLAEGMAGRPILDHAIAAVLGLADDVDVVVVVAPGATRPIPPEARLVHDVAAFEGPLAGVAVGLDALSPEVDRVVIVGGDMPTLVPAVLSLLLRALTAADAAVLDQGDRTRPLPMAARREVAARRAGELLGADDRRLRALPEALGAVVIPATTWRSLDPIGASLRDIDLPGDL